MVTAQAIAKASLRRDPAQLALALGVGHCISDGAAGWMIGALAGHLPPPQLGALVLLYNLLAFGGQVPAGLLVDRVGRARLFAVGSLALMAAALLLLAGDGVAGALLPIGLAGVASALFHVAGGAIALRSNGGRAAAIGLFAAPGVLGLAAGGLIAASAVDPRPALVWLLGAVALAICALRAPVSPPAARPASQTGASHTPQLDGHDLVMIALLAAIALRSLVWNVVSLLAEGRHELLLGLALAATIGKIVGGPLADRVGWRRYVCSALLLAAPLLALGGGQIAALLLGVALLQSATPAAIAMTYRLLPRAPATVAGLTFGAAIAAGGVPLQIADLTPLLRAPPLLAAALLVAALIGHIATRWPRALRERSYD